MSKLLDIVKPGVLTGDDVQKVFAYAKANRFAIPAMNCVGSDSVNAALEAAARVRAPVIIQFSNGGAAFYAGKGIKPWLLCGAIAGRQAGALAGEYVPLSLHHPLLLLTNPQQKRNAWQQILAYRQVIHV